MNKYTSNAFIYATIVAMGGFLFGLDAVLISGTLDFLKAEFGLNAIEVGGIASAPALAVLIAVPFAGIVSDKYGRKLAIIIIAIRKANKRVHIRINFTFIWSVASCLYDIYIH